jgi:ubiquinol-cytochrome c reductase iron-sulfur subunit
MHKITEWVSAVLMAAVVVSLAACRSNTSTRVDIRNLQPGELMKVKVEVESEQKTVYIVRRTQVDLNNLATLTAYVYSDEELGKPAPRLGVYRSLQPDVFVVVGESPYTRCVLSYMPGPGKGRSGPNALWFGGFYSSCHDETFDLAGRQIKPYRHKPQHLPGGPHNLEIPPYQFITDHELLIGTPSKEPTK